MFLVFTLVFTYLENTIIFFLHCPLGKVYSSYTVLDVAHKTWQHWHNVVSILPAFCLYRFPSSEYCSLSLKETENRARQMMKVYVVRLRLSCLNSCCKHILWTWANNLFLCAPKSLNICLYLNRASLLHFHRSILRTLVKSTIKIRMPWSPTAHCYFCRGAVELVILSVLRLPSAAERMEKVTALTIPWGWHNKCMSTVIVTKLLVIKQAVWKDLLPFSSHKAYPTCGKGMLLSTGQFCSIIWQHDSAYQFFSALPHEYTYIILKAIYNTSKCLRRLLKI